MIRIKQFWQAPAIVLSGSLLLAVAGAGCATQGAAIPAAAAQPPRPSAEELDQLVAPIALYPDSLVAQILAASSYPTEVVEAERWMKQHPGLQGSALAKAVDQQSWDPSVKALTQFPTVLASMDENLSWTSALGEAYTSNPRSVLDVVQVLRRRAQQAGNLKSTPQETVTGEGQTIVIQPANPEVVYVPEYDPWVVYGAPLAFYPGWVGVPGLYLDEPGIAFGLGVGIGIYGGFGWGWHHWDTDWHRHDVLYDHHHHESHSPTFDHHGWGADGHGHFDHGHFDHGHGAAGHADLGHSNRFAHLPPGVRSGAFGGFNHGGVAKGFSFRGRASLGGGGRFGGGAHAGGGFHGGGFHGGGGSHGGGGHR